MLKEFVGEYNLKIRSLAFDSKRVNEGCLFFCLSGILDGHDFAAEAVSKGAVALVCERRLSINVPQMIVGNARSALSFIAAEFYGDPQKSLKIIGVTGTNGKTTTSYIIREILDCAKKQTGLIGTNGIFFTQKKQSSLLTTPDPIELFETLAIMKKEGIEYVVMEVSAHALALNKTDAINFDVAAFTNLTQDHLDFFADMRRYGDAKARLFAQSRVNIINADDEFGVAIADKFGGITYGYSNPADVFGIDLRMSEQGLAYVLNLHDQIFEVRFALPGKFNMYNTMCAAAVTSALGIDADTIREGIKRVKKIDGRFNLINTIKGSVIIDFAHTEDGLRNVLEAVGEFVERRIITVFGCGGNRDKEKRCKMGKVAGEMSDYIVITSDNPRFEEPMSIMREIERGVIQSGTPYILLLDRKEAIKYAIENSQQGDVVLIAGKGAENYQDVMGKKIHFSDEEFVMELVAEAQI